MRVLCSLSGLQFNVDHISYYLDERTSYHPIFDVPQKRLITLALRAVSQLPAQVEEGTHVAEEPYLLALALLASTELVEWSVPAQVTPRTASLVASSLPALIRIAGVVAGVTAKHKVFPRFAVTPESKTLDSLPAWIAAWELAWENFREGYRTQSALQDIIRREQVLEAHIRNTHKRIAQYGTSLANWADAAATFPHFTTSTLWGTMRLADYWKRIIVSLANHSQILAIPKRDIEELREHCIDNIAAGSICHHTLLKLLNDSINEADNFFGSTEFTLLMDTENESKEAVAIRHLVDTAPQEVPQESNYATKLAYLIARNKYDMAQMAQLAAASAAGEQK